MAGPAKKKGTVRYRSGGKVYEDGNVTEKSIGRRKPFDAKPVKPVKPSKSTRTI